MTSGLNNHDSFMTWQAAPGKKKAGRVPGGYSFIASDLIQALVMAKLLY
ncbi:hypothetical protein PT7_1336 [Pusillimonas sp. T7-7]|nr:hypothetical protein PT7_1336 [Pusillimonas sp. T7-7]